MLPTTSYIELFNTKSSLSPENNYPEYSGPWDTSSWQLSSPTIITGDSFWGQQIESN